MKNGNNKKKHFTNQPTIEALLHSLIRKAKRDKDTSFADNLHKLLSEYNSSERKVRQSNNIDIEEEGEDLGISQTVLMDRFNLNAKQAKFVKSYLVTGNGSRSAQLAGYVCTSDASLAVMGNQILSSINVKEALEWCYGRLEEKTKVTPEWVIMKLKEIVERCMQAKQVLDKLGRPTGMYTFDSAGSNRALELLAKHLGMFIERLDLTVNNKKLSPIQEKELIEMSPELATQRYLELIKSVDVNVLESNPVRKQLQLKENNGGNKFKRGEKDEDK